ncbi:MAG: threonine--tRNA ligase [Candidatus Pacebacteria bacterium]|nr:threonine--tRNA ligase [Candidatus Paceibacterota bacterium]
MSEEYTPIYKVRHSLAHLLAKAVLEHFPDAQPTIGPAIDHGFYYDFAFSQPFSDKDLKAIEKTMKKMKNSWHGFEKRVVTAEEARAVFAGNPFKLELIHELAEKGEEITLYVSGQGKTEFIDLCRGGHVDDMARDIDGGQFTLDRVAGAYWRGDEKNPMLTRIYGLAFESADALDAHLELRKEAEARDHRKLGIELDLFTFSDLVGSGLPLFTPKGTAMRDAIIEKIQRIQKNYGYQKVTIPHITKKDLYETSGHWQKFGDELFKVKGQSDTEFVMKPMNCPHHTQLFAAHARSYRDLPIRFMESTMVYRDEQAGELLGLSRVRSITQDDGHVFCTPEQIKEEVRAIIDVIRRFYTSLDMWGDERSYWVSLSVRDPQTPEKYLGNPERWDTAESILAEVAQEEGLHIKRVEGEAAFYGPKLDFQFFDALGRERQLATAQLDFVMPERFGLEYTDSDGQKKNTSYDSPRCRRISRAFYGNYY